MQTGVLGYQGARIGLPVACRPKFVNEKILGILLLIPI
jgi:hypothetical protein